MLYAAGRWMAGVQTEGIDEVARNSCAEGRQHPLTYRVTDGKKHNVWENTKKGFSFIKIRTMTIK